MGKNLTVDELVAHFNHFGRKGANRDLENYEVVITGKDSNNEPVYFNPVYVDVIPEQKVVFLQVDAQISK
jgi:hypothetical protein